MFGGLDRRFRLYGLYSLLLQNFSVTTSALNGERLEAEFEERQRRSIETTRLQAHLDYRKKTDWSLLLKPIELFKAVRRQHNNSYKFLFGIIHLVIDTYFSVEALIPMLGFEGSEINVSYNLDVPRLLRNCIGFTLFILVALRLLFIWKLIVISIKNYDRYEEIKPSQLTLSYLSAFRMSLRDFFILLLDSFKHEKCIKEDYYVRRAHISCTTNKIFESYDESKMSRLDKMYYFNMIDMNNCMKEYDHCFSFESENSNTGRIHIAQPFHRCDLTQLKKILLFTSVSFVVTFVVIVITSLILNYIDLVHIQAEHEGLEHFYEVKRLDFHFMYTNLFSSKTIIRSLKLITLAVLQSSYRIDGGLFNIGCIIFCSRLTKVKDMFDYELMTIKRINIDRDINFSDASRRWAVEYRSAFCVNVHSNNIYRRNTTNMRRLEYELDENLDYQAVNELNQRLLRYSNLVRLLSEELIDIKREWTVYLELLIIWSAFYVAYIIAIAYSVSDSIFGTLLLVGAIATSAIPTMMYLSSGASIEIVFRKIHKIVSALMVNELLIIDSRTLKTMQSIAERISCVEQRSIVIGGHFSLTFGSIVPIVGWILTIVLLLNRMINYSND